MKTIINLLTKNFVPTFILLSLLPVMNLKPLSAGPIIKIDDDAWLKINYEAQLYGKWRNDGSGPEDKNPTSDIYFRRNRLIFTGKQSSVLDFRFSIEHHGTKKINDFTMSVSDDPIENFGIMDAYISANFTDAFRLKAGLNKDILVREHNEGCYFALSPDRSYFVYTPLPRGSRDYGVVAWGNLLKAMVQYKFAIMEGNDSPTDPISSFRYSGRLHVSLLDKESADVYSASYLGHGHVFTVGAGYQFEPSAAYSDTATKKGEKDYKAWTVDAFYEVPTKAGTISLMGAFLKIDFDEAYKGANPAASTTELLGERTGWQARLGYLLPMTLGFGKLQVFGRYEQWNYASLLGITGQKINWTAAGLNYYIIKGFDSDDDKDDEKKSAPKSIYNSFKEQAIRLSLEYAQAGFDKETTAVKNYKTVTLMFQLMF